MVWFLLQCGPMRATRLLCLVGIVVAFAGSQASCGPSRSYCGRDLDCRPGTVCDDHINQCVIPGCTSDDECGSGRVCNASFNCETGCRSDEGCAAGFICESQLFDTGPNQCVRGCRFDADCPVGKVCGPAEFLQTRQCVAGCQSNAECPPRTFCSNSSCVSGCHDDGECGSPGSLCVQGTCSPRCDEASDCGGFACVALHADGSFRTDDAGRFVVCGAGHRCKCSTNPVTSPPHPTTPNDAGADARGADFGAVP
jgi:hypothetical protein